MVLLFGLLLAAHQSPVPWSPLPPEGLESQSVSHPPASCTYQWWQHIYALERAHLLNPPPSSQVLLLLLLYLPYDYRVSFRVNVRVRSTLDLGLMLVYT